MAQRVFDDLQSFVVACQEIDEWRRIEAADWDSEIGALVEATAELIPDPPLLIHDRIKGHEAGLRVVSLLFASRKRAALALDLPRDRSRLELSRLAARKIRESRPIPPIEVLRGPVMDNVLSGTGVDLTRFPALRFHPGDGGRYIGTGDCVVMRDPESGFINMGTYRIQLHEPDLLGIWFDPGQQGEQICQRYWARGECCPVVVTFGQDPLTFMASHTKLPWGRSELDYVGGLRGRPLEVLAGPVSGLPIPAHGEIAIEGEIPPPAVQAREEGPFGEFPGYYSGGTLGTGRPQPVIRVKALYHRDQPMLLDMATLWTEAPRFAFRAESGMLWDQLESAGVQDVVGVHMDHYLFVVVAIRQRFAGHAKQVGHAVLGCAATARLGRHIVIVDEDIDPTDAKEVQWAINTRLDPATDIEVVDGCWSSPLDPRMPPAKKTDPRNPTMARAIFYAVRPFAWYDAFPKVSRAPRELRRQVIEKYRGVLPFPPTV